MPMCLLVQNGGFSWRVFTRHTNKEGDVSRLAGVGAVKWTHGVQTTSREPVLGEGYDERGGLNRLQRESSSMSRSYRCLTS